LITHAMKKMKESDQIGFHRDGRKYIAITSLTRSNIF